MDDIVDTYLGKNIYFQDCKNKAFSVIMNDDKFSKLLAFFADSEFRQGFNGLKDQQITERLDNIMNLFKCINSKLAFKLEYSRCMSNRLIQGKSLSIFAEKTLVGKLKADVGISYVDTLSTMLQDVDNNNTEFQLFKDAKHGVTLINVGCTTRI
jgi:hypothetical protein